MSDNFYFIGMDGGNGWFSGNFESYHLFGYLGDRERLHKSMTEKSTFRKVVEAWGPHVNIGSIVNALAHYSLLKVDPDKTLAKEIINIVTSAEHSRTLTQLLEATNKRLQKSHRYFDRVAYDQYGKRTLLADETRLNSLQDQLLTIEGQLVHRSAVGQYSKAVAASLKESKHPWLLADFPPHAFIEDNTKFNGKVLLLREDEGFTQTFGTYLPFCEQLAWYPYVRVTGFLDSSKIATEIYPSLSISLVEYRRPRHLHDIQRDVLHFMEREFASPNYLEERSNMLLLGYLFPITFKGSNVGSYEADEAVAQLLRTYHSRVALDLPVALHQFYNALPTPGAA